MLVKLKLNSNYIDTYHKLLTLDWFENCGTNKNTDYDFHVELTNDLDYAIRSITSIGWQNICINYTFELDKDGKKNESVSWAGLFESLQQEYFPTLEKQLINKTAEEQIPSRFRENIMTNIIHIFKFDDDHGLENSEFFLKVIKIYLSGHVPCKWIGDRETGGFLVY
ncbi:MAG: hypothetical protein R3Y54_00595 [Eubacteriales bacterium]